MSKTALNRYKKRISKVFKQIKSKILENKKRSIFILSVFGLLIILLSVFFIFRIKPNDDIFVLGSNNPSLYANENPNFTVNFGKKEEPDKQWVRFESKSSINNPFSDEKPNLFEKVVSAVLPRQSLGIEMSVIGLGLGETKTEDLKNLDEEIQTVAELLGTDDIETSTELIEMGREIGVYDDEQIISKETIVHKQIGDGIDLEYQILPGIGLKEEIVLQSLEAFNEECLEDISKCKLPLNEYAFELKLDDGVVLNTGWYTVKGKSTESYYFTDEKGNYISHFLPSFAIDSGGGKTYDVSLTIEETEEENIYRIDVIADLEWLLSPERVFPIRIDPSIVHDDSADFDGGVYSNTEFDVSEINLSKPEYLPSDSTISLWHMDETSDDSCIGGEDVCDSGVNAFDGVVGGSPDIVDGVLGKARDFDGSTDYVSVTNDTLLNPIDEWTLSAWIKREVTGVQHSVIEKYNWSAGQGIYLLRVTSGDVVSASVINGTTTSSCTGVTTIRSGQWYHIAVTFSANTDTLICYVNGKVDNVNTSATVNGISSSNSLRIGCRGNDCATKFNGIIDEVEIADIAYSDSQIDSLYQKAFVSEGGYYQSNTIDMGASANVSSFSWIDSATHTGGGETPYSTTGLVAQWNLNETSGTTAVSGGSCSTSCNGTLTSMTTTGQDDSLTSGWTYDYRKWGLGAVKIDGADDYITIADVDDLDITSAVTIDTWVNFDNVTDAYQTIISKRDASALEANYALRTGTGTESDELQFYFSSGGAWQIYTTSTAYLESSKWYHIVVTYDGTTVKIYENGQLLSGSCSNGTCNVPMSGDDNAVILGKNGGTTEYFEGVIDTVRIYSRVLTESEILSNYQSGNIEFQYRYSDDNTTWSNWEGGSSRKMDIENSYEDIVPDQLVRYDFEDDGETTITDREDNYDGTLGGNTARTDGTIGGAMYFDGTDDYVHMGDIAEMDAPSTFTMAMWFNRTTDNSGTANDTGHLVNNVLFGQSSAGVNDNFELGTEGTKLEFYVDAAGTDINGVDGGIVEVGLQNDTWHHIVAVFDYRSSTEFKVYFDGEEVYSNGGVNTALASSITSPASLGIARAGSDNVGDYNGYIDEFIISTEVLSPVDIKNLYHYGKEGYKNEKDTYDPSLVTYYTLDETTGDLAGDDFADGSSYSNDGEIEGSGLATGSVDGVLSKARDFNGSDDYFTAGSTNIPTGASGEDVSVAMWLNADTVTGQLGIIGRGGGTSAPTDWLMSIESGKIWVRTNGGNNNGTSATLSINTWYHVVFTWGVGNGHEVYVNGVSGGYYANTDTSSSTEDYLSIGSVYNSGALLNSRFDGTLDDIRVYDRLLSEYEIEEIMEARFQYYEPEEVEGSDLNGYSNVQVDVASDTVGDNGNFIIGDSAYANYEPDQHTVGLWHMDEELDNLCIGSEDVCDSSVMGNHGVNVTTPTIVDGVYGKGREFNGVADKSSTPDNINITDINFTSTDSWTLSFWAKPDSSYTSTTVPFGNTAAADPMIYYSSGTTITPKLRADDGTYIATPATPKGEYDVWNHHVFTYEAGDIKNYWNGQLIGSGTKSTTMNFDAIGWGYTGSTTYLSYDGELDEVRIDSVARTPEEIRQAYDIGSRTHDIEIDFKADLQSSNLIADSSDLSFTISETEYGTTDEIENLEVGDKIIITEKIDGVEYIAQGEIDTRNTGTGAVTVVSWDSDSTFPSSGFTVNANVLKWETKYLDIRNLDKDFKNSLSILTSRLDNKKSLFWVDNIRRSKYLTDTITNTEEQLDSLDTGSESILLKEGTASVLMSTNSENITITATDISSYTRIPFWIASDELGKQVSVMYSENAYANYESDANTLGLWHMNETTENTCSGGEDACDSSSSANHGTANAVLTVVDGKYDMARSFDGAPTTSTTPEYLDITDIDFASTDSWTLSFWAKPDSSYQYPMMPFGDKNLADPMIFLSTGSELTPKFRADDGTYVGTPATSKGSFDEWNHYVFTYDNGSVNVYWNGQLTGSGTKSSTMSFDTIGWGYTNSTLYYSYDGEMDEVRIDNIARTETEVRQAYEIGQRSHIVNVEFKADLDSGNLIADNSDLSFTISETEYGTTDEIENIEVGDTIVVANREENDDYLRMTSSTPVEGGNNYYIYQKALEGSSLMVNTGDTVEYDVYLDHNIAKIGGVDLQFTNSTFARDSGWTDQNGIECHPNADISTYAYETWYSRKCTVPSILNGRLLSFVSFVDEGSETDVATLYDNVIIKNSSGVVKATLYTSGDSDYDTAHLSNNGSANIENIVTIGELTEYKAQGTVATINTSTGALTVSSWDSGSTFPVGGYTTSAVVFKWQQEYIDLRVTSDMEADTDAVTDITFKKLNGGFSNILIDDIRAGEDLAYIGTPQYFQYKAILTTTDTNLTPSLSSVTIDYSESETGPTNDLLMRHGQWFNSSGVKQGFWWTDQE